MGLPGTETMDRKTPLINDTGFTLVELLVAVAISGLVISAIYSTFTRQQSIHTAQEQAVGAQQNIRAAMELLTRQIRMAGHDPKHSAGAGFVDGVSFSNGGGPPPALTAVTTDATNISFTADLDEDGTIDQAPQDINGDGNNDLTEMEQIAFRLNGTNLQMYSTRTGAIAWQTVAENIASLEFYYLDTNGAPTAVPGDIRSVEISILTTPERPDPDFLDTDTYTTGSGATWGPFNDNFRRRFLRKKITCLNLLGAP